jgi:regulator of sigma E protease
MVLVNIIALLLLLLTVVIVHEFGHYIAAVLNGVQVTDFSFGYGREIFGRTDKRGTRWKICLLPFGGFCRFFGDEDESSSITSAEKLNNLSEEDKKKCLYFKNVWQRMIIVSAGPIFNYLLSILIFTIFFALHGKGIITNKITQIIPNGAADKAGLQVGDVIISIDGDHMEDFEEIQYKIFFANSDKLKFETQRGDERLFFDVIPEIKEKKDIFNAVIRTPVVGIGSNDYIYKKLGIFRAFFEGVEQTYSITKNTLKGIWRMIIGRGGMDDLGGPIKISQYSGQALRNGVGPFVFFIALISTVLGLMNLLPIPALDGGHIFFYILEIVRGKRLEEKIENILSKIGFGVLMLLMVFVTLKDFVGIFK